MDVVVGRIGRAHGIRGEVSIDLMTDEPERRFAPGSSVVARPGDRRLTIGSTRPHQGRLLVAFDEVPDRTAAEGLRGSQIVVQVDAEERPDDPDEFYDHQLEGLRVLRAGVLRGVVREVLHLPSQDLLAIVVDDDTEVLVPFVGALVPVVDLDAGELHVADLPGLLDPDQAETAEPT